MDGPVIIDASPNLKKGAPKEATSLDTIMIKEKKIKDDAVIATKPVTKLPRFKRSNRKVSNKK